MALSRGLSILGRGTRPRDARRTRASDTADSADYSASHPETYATGAYPPVGIPREGFSAAGGDRGGDVYKRVTCLVV